MTKLITITGPSCSGKTTLVRKLLALDDSPFVEITSFTSRQPRQGEIDGVDYHFKSVEECEHLIDHRLTAEHIKFKDCYYGIEKREIDAKLNSGKTPVVIVEPKGLRQLNKNYDCFSVYVDSNLNTLYNRFLTRFRGMPDADIKYEAKRLETIQNELMTWYDECTEVNKICMHIPIFDNESEERVIQHLVGASTFYNKK